MTKKQIDTTEYASLSQKEKLSLLRRDGVYVGKIARDDQIGILFQLYSFYVEVRYIDYRKTISEILVSDNIEVLQPFLHQIVVKDLDTKDDEKKDDL